MTGREVRGSFAYAQDDRAEIFFAVRQGNRLKNPIPYYLGSPFRPVGLKGGNENILVILKPLSG